MNQYEYKVRLQAKNEQEARQALEAMLSLKKNLSHEDLLLFAKAVKEKPNLIKQAKRFL